MHPLMKDPSRGRFVSLAARALFSIAGGIALTATALAQHVANPFVGATQYLNPDYTTEVNSAITTAGSSSLAAQMKAVATYPTAVWLDRIAAINGGDANSARLGLAQHIATALSQQVGTEPVVVTLVIYDLPGRDCAALASNGEISIAGNGTLTGIEQYKQNYITPIYNVLSSYATNPNLRFVLIIEPDSLPNLVTNTGMGASPIANCVAANGGQSGSPSLTSVYVQGVQYALNTFHPLTNVYQYLDIGQSAWLGWTSNLGPAVQLYNGLVKGATAGYASLDGFISNTSNYVPTVEPFLTATQQVGGKAVDSADFFQYDPAVDELSYIQEFNAAATRAGFPGSIGYLIDTSRNGWGGPKRPTAASTATDVNTFVNASKIDERPVRGVWCNIQAAGIGALPAANPGGFANLLAYVWVKPPGESDGTYPGSTYGGTASTACDPNCNPANTNALAGGATDSLPDSPPAGTFWPAEFALNVQNAYPPIPSSTQPGFALTAAPVTVAPGATANDTVNVTASGGFAGVVTLTAAGLPVGVTVTFSPTVVTGSGSSTLTFTADSTASSGSSTVTVTGAAESVTSTVAIPLTIGSGGSTGSSGPTASLSSATLSVPQGGGATDTVSVSGFSGGAVILTVTGLPNGVTAVFSPNPASTTSLLQLNANNTAALGASTVMVTATQGDQSTASATLSLAVVAPAAANAGFNLSLATGNMTITRGSSANNTISVAPSNGFTGAVTLQAAINSSPTGAENRPTVSFNATSPVSITGTSPGTATLSILTSADTPSSCSAGNTMPNQLLRYGGHGAMLAGLLLFVIPRRRFAGRRMLNLVLLFVALAGGTIACSSSTNVTGKTCANTTSPGTTVGTYVINVTATSGALTETQPVTLTVQ